MTFGLALTGVLVLAGCGNGEGFSRHAYCAALAAEAGLDTKKLVDGDSEELAKAQQVYQKLQALAPPQLTDEWAVVVDGLEAMLEAARTGLPSSQVDQSAFSSALGTIDMDRIERCPD